MIRHLFKIVWHRRRSNLLIAVEILLSFLVLGMVVTLGVFLLDNYRRPLGYAYEDTWAVRINMHVDVVLGAKEAAASAGAAPDATPAGRRARIATLLRLLRAMPEVAGATSAMTAPYAPDTWTSGISVGGRDVDFGANQADDAFAETLKLQITRGRWFSRADDGSKYRSTVINERLARELFGAQDPVGRTITEDPPKVPDQEQQPPMRVVGVIRDFRKDGELEPAGNFAFYRDNMEGLENADHTPSYLIVRVHPGATAGFEEKMIRRLQSGERDWSFTAGALERRRSAVLREYVPAITIAALIAGFLLLMVALGLTGVLWQTVTQRTREIGLRRAKGATIPNIQHQVLGEVLVLTSLAVAVGTLVMVQFPLLNLFGVISGGVYLAGLVISVACIYLLSIACAWAPSRLATSVSPAEALRYE